MAQLWSSLVAFSLPPPSPSSQLLVWGLRSCQLDWSSPGATASTSQPCSGVQKPRGGRSMAWRGPFFPCWLWSPRKGRRGEGAEPRGRDFAGALPPASQGPLRRQLSAVVEDPEGLGWLRARWVVNLGQELPGRQRPPWVWRVGGSRVRLQRRTLCLPGRRCHLWDSRRFRVAWLSATSCFVRNNVIAKEFL